MTHPEAVEPDRGPQVTEAPSTNNATKGLADRRNRAGLQVLSRLADNAPVTRDEMVRTLHGVLSAYGEVVSERDRMADMVARVFR